MVDLRESLRPAGSANPLPISEIAARAGRRRRRRLATVTAAALLATAGSAALIINTLPRSNAAIVADAAEPTPSTTDRPEPASGTEATPPTTGPAATEAAPDAGADNGPEDAGPTEADPAGDNPADAEPEQATDTGPEPTDTESPGIDRADTEPGDPETGSENAEPLTTPGLRTETTTTSRWEDGYCVEIEVNNEGETTARTWQVVLDLDGRIATLWSAAVDDSVDGRFVFSGVDGYNAVLDAGALTTFGACLDVEAG